MGLQAHGAVPGRGAHGARDGDDRAGLAAHGQRQLERPGLGAAHRVVEPVGVETRGERHGAGAQVGEGTGRHERGQQVDDQMGARAGQAAHAPVVAEGHGHHVGGLRADDLVERRRRRHRRAARVEHHPAVGLGVGGHHAQHGHHAVGRGSVGGEHVEGEGHAGRQRAGQRVAGLAAVGQPHRHPRRQPQARRPGLGRPEPADEVHDDVGGHADAHAQLAARGEAHVGLVRARLASHHVHGRRAGHAVARVGDGVAGEVGVDHGEVHGRRGGVERHGAHAADGDAADLAGLQPLAGGPGVAQPSSRGRVVRLAAGAEPADDVDDDVGGDRGVHAGAPGGVDRHHHQARRGLAGPRVHVGGPRALGAAREHGHEAAHLGADRRHVEGDRFGAGGHGLGGEVDGHAAVAGEATLGRAVVGAVARVEDANGVDGREPHRGNLAGHAHPAARTDARRGRRKRAWTRRTAGRAR